MRKNWREERAERNKPEITCPDVQNMLNIDITIPDDVTTGRELWEYVDKVLETGNNIRIDDLCNICRRCGNCQCGYQKCDARNGDVELTKAKLSMFVNFTN